MVVLLTASVVVPAQDNFDDFETSFAALTSDSARVSLLTERSTELSASNSLEALRYARSSDSLASLHQLKNLQGWAKKAVGLAMYNLGDYIGAVENWQLALQIFQEVGNQDGESNILNNLGATMNDQGDDAKAMDYFFQSLEIAQSIADSIRIGTAQLNVGSVYLKKSHTLEQSVDWFRQAIPYFEGKKYGIGLGVLYLNMGDAYLQREQIDSAVYYLKKSQFSFESIGAGLVSHAYNFLGKAYILDQDFESALAIQKKSLEAAEAQGAKLGIAHAKLGLAQTYQNMSSSGLARANFLEAEQMFKELKSKQGLSDVYAGLAENHASTGSFRDAFYYQELLGRYKDSLYDVSIDDELRTLRFTRDLAEKESEISLLNKENEVQEAELERARTTRNFMIALAAFILITLGGIYWQYLLTRRNREKEEALQREKELNDELQKIDRLKDKFLANTSHELRTPLNGIIGLADSLFDGAAGDLPDKAKHDLQMISSSGRRLSNLVNDILDFSKLRNHDLQLQIRPLDLHSLTNIVLQVVQPLIFNKELNLVNAISPSAPLVDADENRIQQIMLNLVENAIKFSEVGDIVVSSDLVDDHVVVSIKDPGIGIRKDMQQVIFETFEQGDEDISNDYGGTGLGLSVTKKLVELHRGEIWVESVVGEGSTFFFTLSPSKVDRSEVEEDTSEVKQKLSRLVEAPETEVALPVFSPREDDGVRVLVVDDEPVNRQVLENHLNLAGYQVSMASNGEEALQLIEQGEFDIILLDVMMPKMNGFEVCSKLRELYLPNELTVVMLTAKNQVSDLVAGFNVGANDYLTKPFAKDELLSRLGTHISLHRYNQAAAKFVPVEFLGVLGHNTITDIKLGEHREKEVTVFFSDIRSYVTLTELMPPDENFRFVTSYSRRMGPIIGRNRGFISQYLGDGIMAIFPEDPNSAIAAGIEMQLSLQQFNRERASKGRAAIEVGMGIHTGPLIMGVIGDGRRLEPAMVSKNVNITSRIEGLTKYFGANILFSESTYEKIAGDDRFNTRSIGLVQVKGLEKPIRIYECFDGDLPDVAKAKKDTLTAFRDGLNLYYDKDFVKAEKAFHYVITENPQDKVAANIHERIKLLLESGIAEDWTGVLSVEGK